jgi:hypothetical protein
VQLEVIVVLGIGLSRHAQVFEREVPLLVDVPVVILRDLWRRYVVLWPPSLLLQPGLLDGALVELLYGRATHGKILCLGRILGPIVRVGEHLAVGSVRYDGSSCVLDRVGGSGVGVGRRSKVLVLYLSVDIYDILVLVELLDFRVDGMRCVLLGVYLDVVLLLDSALAPRIPVAHVIETVLVILVLDR